MRTKIRINKVSYPLLVTIKYLKIKGKKGKLNLFSRKKNFIFIFFFLEINVFFFYKKKKKKKKKKEVKERKRVERSLTQYTS